MKCAILLCCFAFFGGQMVGETPWKPDQIHEEVILDGLVNEPFWDQLEPMPLIQQQPFYNEPGKLRTELLMGYDQRYIYLGARCFVDDASQISLNTKKRDALTGATDWVGIVLDSYNDNENALAFFVNPNGVRWDAAVFNDAIGQLPLNMDWNTFWNVATTHDDNGWYAEVRIPWTSLNITSIEGNVEMGIIASRWSAYHNENDIFPDIAPEWGDWSGMKPSLAHDIQFNGINRKRPLYIAPYVLSGVETTNELNEAEEGYNKDRNNRLEPGIDIKIGVTDNLTLDLSANTDFAQVEADDQQVNLTRFSLFFPEKRLFFQERQAIFNFGLGRQDNLFYSRRIGLDDDNNPVRIYGGARMTGKMGHTNVGFLNMHTEDEGSSKGRNYTVARVQQPILNGRSTGGVMLMNTSNLNGDYNTTYGVDAVLRYGKAQVFELKYAQSFEDGNENQFFAPLSTRFFTRFSRQSTIGWNYSTFLAYAGRDFNPEMGFQIRDDFFRYGARVSYGFFPAQSATIFQHGPSITQSVYQSNSNHKIESYFSRYGYQIVTKSGYNFSANYIPSFDRVDESFDLSEEIEVQPGPFHNRRLGLSINTPFANPWQLSAQIEGGRLYGNDLINFSLSPTWALSSSVELSGTYVFNRLSQDESQINDVLHLARLRVLYMFSTKLSIASFIQLNTQSKRVASNIRLRFNPKEGNDLFLVFNSDANLDRMRDIPIRPSSNARTLILKYTYTFVL